MSDEKGSPEEQALRTTAPFSALPAEERRRLTPFARVRRHEKGDTIFREGDPSERFYTVVTGRVKVVKFAPFGKELILKTFVHIVEEATTQERVIEEFLARASLHFERVLKGSDSLKVELLKPGSPILC